MQDLWSTQVDDDTQLVRLGSDAAAQPTTMDDREDAARMDKKGHRLV